MKLIDTHAHLLDRSYENSKIIYEDTVKKVWYIFNIAYDVSSSHEVLKHFKEYSHFFPVIGIHPNHTTENDDLPIKEIENLINSDVKAIGEIGLDYFRPHNKKNQRQAFIKQIKLAGKYHLPIVVHTRESLEETWEIIKKFPDQKFLLHAWSGDVLLTKEILAARDNIWFSYNGITTFNNAQKQRETIVHVPLNRLLMETDCPFLTPVPNRGKPNVPAYVELVINFAANLFSMNVEKFNEQVNKNAEEFYEVLLD